MRLLTRSDFDGLACAVFLKEAGIIDHWKFVHPKDLQDGLVEVCEDDCLANVPFVEGCGLTIIPVKRNVMHIKENIKGKAEPHQAVRILFMNIMAVKSDFQNMMIYWRL